MVNKLLTRDNKNMKKGKILAISISEKRGERKYNVPQAKLIEAWGLEGDAHGGFGHRQVSLLGIESIKLMQHKSFDVKPGDFAENITVEGLVLYNLLVGTRLVIGETELEVSQIGKACHQKCEIFERLGDCIMPRQGIFAVVKKGGIISVGDEVLVMD